MIKLNRTLQTFVSYFLPQQRLQICSVNFWSSHEASYSWLNCRELMFSSNPISFPVTTVEVRFSVVRCSHKYISNFIPHYTVKSRNCRIYTVPGRAGYYSKGSAFHKQTRIPLFEFENSSNFVMQALWAFWIPKSFFLLPVFGVPRENFIA